MPKESASTMQASFGNRSLGTEMEIKEKWWHRLIKTLLSGVVVLATLLILAASTTTWTPYGHQYSWEPGWDDAKPSTPCKAFIYGDNSGSRVECGGYYEAADLFDALVKAKLFLPSPSFHSLSETDQGLVVADALHKLPQHYRSGPQFSARNAWISAGATLAALLILSAIAWGSWRIFLYIAHGPGARLTR